MEALKKGMGEYHLGLLAKTAETTEKIKKIIDLDSTMTQEEIAREIGVSRNVVGKILRKIILEE